MLEAVYNICENRQARRRLELEAAFRMLFPAAGSTAPAIASASAQNQLVVGSSAVTAQAVVAGGVDLAVDADSCAAETPGDFSEEETANSNSGSVSVVALQLSDFQRLLYLLCVSTPWVSQAMTAAAMPFVEPASWRQRQQQQTHHSFRTAASAETCSQTVNLAMLYRASISETAASLAATPPVQKWPLQVPIN